MRRALPLLLVLSACAPSADHKPAPVYNALLENHDTNAGAHMVGQGEDISTIAKNYNLTIDDILQANNLASAGQVGPGQRLLLPSDNLMKASTATYAPVGPNDPNMQTYTARADDGNDDNQGGALVAAESLAPIATASNEPVTRETLAPMATQQQPAATSLSDAATPPQPVTAPQPTAPVRVASNLPPEQWQTPLASGFRWPVRGPTLSQFGQSGEGLRNDGINIGALEGTPVEAAADGEVVYNGNAVEGFGNLLLIKHKDGFVTAYGHLSRVDVAKGQTIHAGDIIGGAGKTGNVNAPQLHFQVRKNGAVVNPLQYLSKEGMSPRTAGL